MSLKSAAINAGVSVAKVPVKAIGRSAETVSAGIDAVGDVGTSTFNVVGKTFTTADKISGKAMDSAVDVANSARNLNKTALDTVENAAETSKQVSGQLLKLTERSSGAASNFAGTSVEQSSNVASNAVTSFANASIAVLKTVDSVTTGVANKLVRNAKSYTALGENYQVANFRDTLRDDFRSNIQTMVLGLLNLANTKLEFIEGCFQAFRIEKCPPGRLYGYTCTPEDENLLSKLKLELRSLDRRVRAMALNIQSLSAEVAGVLVKVHTDESQDLNTLNAKMKAVLDPKYQKAADIFDKALGLYTTFEQKIIHLFETTGGGKRRKQSQRVKVRTVKRRRRRTRTRFRS